MPDTAVFVYKVWVRPVIKYAGAVWGDVSDTLFYEQVAMIQRKFLARALGVRNRALPTGSRLRRGWPH